MSGYVAKKHRMTGNGAAGRLQFATGRIASVEAVIWVVRVLFHVALVCWVRWCIADRIGARSEARMAVLWIVGVAHKVAQNLGVTGQIDVAHGIYFGWRASRCVLRVIRVFG